MEWQISHTSFKLYKFLLLVCEYILGKHHNIFCEEMREDDEMDFMEIPDEIPIKKIQFIKMISINFKPELSQFSIKIQKKC